MSISIELAKEFRFEAAHFLPNVPKTHQCHKIHGHSYKVIVRLMGTMDETSGWVMDLCDVSEKFSPLLKMLDHTLLNDIEGLQNPTSENVAIWIFTRLAKTLPELSSITLEATNRISVTVKRKDSQK